MLHQLTYPDTYSQEYSKSRYHYLLQIVYGETIAIDYCKTIATFCEDESAKTFLLQQQAEEERHLEMLTDYLAAHQRPEVAISKYLKKIDGIMTEAVNEKDYLRSIFIQNFIIEGLNVSLLQEIEHHTDGELSEICTAIIKDEVRHMNFGVKELKRLLWINKERLPELLQLQRRVLFYSTLLASNLIVEAKNLGVPAPEFVKNTIQHHRTRIKEANISLPLLDSFLFYVADKVLSLVIQLR